MSAPAKSTKLAIFTRRYLSDPSTYPIIGVMATAVTLYMTMATHELRHPVAKFSAADRAREAPDADRSAEWNEHIAKRHSYSRKQDGAKRDEQQTRVNVEILSSLNTVMRKITGH